MYGSIHTSHSILVNFQKHPNSRYVTPTEKGGGGGEGDKNKTKKQKKTNHIAKRNFTANSAFFFFFLAPEASELSRGGWRAARYEIPREISWRLNQ